MGKYDRYVQVPATGGGKYDKYLLVGQEREKTYGRAGSALIGAQQGQSMGGRDEAAGISAADKDAAVRAGLPEWLVKGADFYNKTNPMTAITSGVANFARGVGLEAQDQSGPKNLTELIADGAPTDPYREQYYAKRNEERAKSQTAAEDNPASYALGNIAGAASVAPLPALGVGKTVLGTAAKVGLEGAAFGGAYGFADSDGNIGDRATGGAVGAAIGGTAGAVLGPAAKYVIAPVFKAVGYKAFTSADNKALDMVLRRAERSGTSLDQVRADFEAWSKTGEVPETLAEFMGPNERGLLSALVTANSGTRAKAGEVLLERGKGEVDRLESAFAKSMGSAGGDFPKVRADAQKARAEDPEAFYKAAHFDQQGQRRFLDPKQTEALSYEIGGSRVAQGSLADAAGYADALGERAVRDEIDAFGKTLASGKKTEKLSVQAADYIERSINRRYGSATQGQVQDIPAGLRSLRDRIRGVIDDTGLGDARATAAERIRRQELLDEGRGFLKPGVDVEDINNTLRGNPKLDIAPASPEGQKAFTVGAARGISDKLRNTADMKGFADAARGIARTPAIREKVAAVRPQKLTKKGLPSKAAKQTRLNQELDQAIERTADRADFTNEMLGNSRTAFRQADMADAGFDDTLAQGIGDVTSELLARGPAAAQANMWQKAAKGAGNYIARPGIMNPKINDAAARVLLAQGDAIPEQLQRLAARQLKRGGPKLKIGAPSAGKGPVRGAGMLAGARGDLASGAAGGAIGSRQGDTPEERRANAAMGFASGIAAKRGAQGLLRAASRPLAREVTRANRMASEAIESIPKPSRPGQPMTGAEADDLLTARLNEVLARKGVDPETFYAGTAKIDQKKFAPMQEAERLVLEDMKALGYGPPADAEWLRAIRTFSPEQYNKWQATGARDMVSKFRQVQGKEMSPEIPPFEGPRVIDSPGRSMLKPRPSNDVRSSGISGKPPKLPKKRLGRSLDDLINEPGPAQPPRPADMPVRKQEPSPQATKPSRKPARTTRDEFGDKPLYTIRRQPKDTPGNLKKGDWLPIEGLKKKQNPILEGQGDGKREWVVLSDSASGAKKAFDRGEGMTKTNGNVQDLLTRGKPKTIFVPIQFGNGKKMRDMVQTAFDDGADVVKLVFPDKREVYVARDASVLRSPRAKFGVRGRDNKDIMAGIPLIGAGAGATSTLEDRPLPDRDSKGRFMAIGSR